MTELLSGTELAGVDLPDGVVGFGIAEISYVLGRQEGESADMLRSMMVLDPAFNTEAMRVGGVSSLIVRGMLAVDGDRVQTRSAAALLEFAAARGTRWTAMGIAKSASPDLAFVVEAPGVTVLLQPRAFGTWYAGFSSPSSPTAALLTGTLRAEIATHPEAAMYFTTESLNHSSRSIFVRRDPAEDRWDVVLNAAGPGTGTRKLVDDSGLNTLFGAFAPMAR